MAMLCVILVMKKITDGIKGNKKFTKYPKEKKCFSSNCCQINIFSEKYKKTLNLFFTF